MLHSPLVSGPSTVVAIAVDQPGAPISPQLWGCFFEDINFGADGGLYAELVKNRGFEFPDPMVGWSVIRPSLAKGSVSFHGEDPFLSENSRYIRVKSEGTALFGLSNEGFRGMGLRAGEAYAFSAQLRLVGGNPKVRVRLYGNDGALLAESVLNPTAKGWQKMQATLVPNDTDEKAHLVVLLDGAGTVEMDFISLFPEKTWKNRPGGLRADMVQALADLRPGFIRFPGGCIVEGSELALRYPWKKTLAPVEARPTLISRWAYDILHRPAPDYYQSFGLGFFEYFQLCEDIGAQPFPVVNCGMACQFNSGELCAPEELDSYIQDALDLIEFANGPVDSHWGSKRAEMGHPQPFNLRYLGVGNEQWGLAYIERYTRFAKVLKAAHPEIALVSSAGASPEDEYHKLAWEKLRPLNADLIDEHCYAKPDWFFANTRRYDRYDRKGPKVVMGEFAAQSVAILSPKNRNNIECALAEAAYMTGLERNADVVQMAAYAPLFAHKEAWQWTPNLIWTDNLSVLKTPNYLIQQLFSLNRGDQVLPVHFEPSVEGENGRLAVSSSWDRANNTVIVKLVNATPKEVTLTLNLSGVARVAGGTKTVLGAENPEAFNTLGEPRAVWPKEEMFLPTGAAFPLCLPANSFTLLRLRVEQ